MELLTENTAPQGISRRRLLLATGVAGCLCFVPSVLAADTVRRRGGVLRAAFNGKASAPVNVLTSTQTPLNYVRARLIWDTLAETDKSQISYRVMQSAETDSSGMRWQLKIRPGIRFSNGAPLTSRDVLYSLHTLATNPTMQSTTLDPVDFQASRVEDPYSLTLMLKQPIGAFDLRLAKAMFVFQQDNPHIGSGGWVLDQCNETVCRLKPAAEYWDESQAPVLDAIHLYGVDDMTARVNGLKARQFDYAGSVPLINVLSERNNRALKVLLAQKDEWGDLGFVVNIARPPFNQPDVVEAFKLSVDRQAMVKTLTFGMGEAANDLYGAGQIWFNHQLPVRPYDPEKARALLKRAGFDSVREAIRTSNYEWGMLESATLLLRQAKPAGFDLSINKIPVADYYADMAGLINAPLKSLRFGSHLLPVSLPGYYYGSHAIYPFSGTANRKLDQLLQVLQQAQGDAITPAVQDVQEYLYYHGGDAIFARMPVAALTAPGLSGVQSAGSFDYPQLRAAWFDSQ